MSKNDTFWLPEDEYAKLVWENRRRNGFPTVSESTLVEISVNLHEIAKQLAEMNGKKPPEDESKA